MAALDAFTSQSTNFTTWLSSLPDIMICSKIKLADYSSRDAGRGVPLRIIEALATIKAGEELFSIPRNAVISTQTSDLKDKIPGIFDVNDAGDAESWQHLTLAVIYELQRGQSSRWAPYIDILPQAFDTLMFWSEEELAELSGTAVINKIGRQYAESVFRERLIPQMRAHPDVFVGLGERSEQDLVDLCHWASTVVMAYAFDISKSDEDEEANEDGFTEDDEQDPPKGMVPMADMLNADAEPNASLYQGDSEVLTMTALRDIEAGEEVLNDYGKLPRSALLRQYGYITPRYADFDVVEIEKQMLDDTVRVVRQTPLSAEEKEKREAYLDEKEMLDTSYDVIWPQVSENFYFFPDDLSRYVKTMLADDQKWKSTAKTGMCDDDLLERYLTTMKKVTKARLQQYPTTMDDDLTMLASTTLPRRKRMAIEVRAGEKKILTAALERLEEKKQAPNHEPASKKRKIG